MIGAIQSLQGLNDQRDKVVHRITDLNTQINNITTGKSRTLKTLLGLKTRQDEIASLEREKEQLEHNRNDLTCIIKLATFNMESYIEYFKVEKLAGYYQSLNQVAEIQKSNTENINSFWGTVRNDKNIQKLMNE
jgi:hypothetical protein